MNPPRAVGAEILCDICHGKQNAVLALSSTAYQDGWFIEAIKNPQTDEVKQFTFCPRCKVEFLRYLASKEGK